MSRKLIKFVFLIFIFQVINAENNDELFGDKSIIRKLRNELGSFKTKLNLTGHIVNEQYDFKSKNGLVIPRIFRIKIWKHSNDFEKYFEIYAGTCDSKMNDNIMKAFLQNWSAPEVVQIPSKFKMLGPSNLLFNTLIDNYDKNKENVHCENLDNNRTRCHIIFAYTHKIEYYFQNTDDIKMYPIKINLLRKYSTQFKLYEEIEFTEFDYSFNGDYRVDFEMPIGYACKPKDVENKNPKIGIDLGENFELEYDAELEYLDMETKDKNVFLKTEFKSQKWSMNKKNSFSILDGIDKKTNKSIRTYLIDEVKSVYEIHNNKCMKYNFESGENAEWINQLHDIKSFPDFFFMNNKSSIWYLDEHKLKNKIYKVFEEEQNSHPKRKGRWFDPRKPYFNVVTHYYSESDNKIPELIEVRTRGLMGEPLLSILKIKVKKHTLLTQSDDLDKIDSEQCYKN